VQIELSLQMDYSTLYILFIIKLKIINKE
jgi:hypothetical protein